MTTTPHVIAEIGQGKGDPAYVVRALEAAKAAGCWAGKIQLLQPETIAQAAAPVYWSEQRQAIDGQRASFATAGCLDYAVVPDLVAAARRIGIELAATPFDTRAVAAMAAAGVGWCKIASGDITNRPLIDAASQAYPGRIILSTGAASLIEVHEALEWITAASRGGAPWAVLACTLAYPTERYDANLGRIGTLKAWRDQQGRKFRVGYSDHLRGSGSGEWAVLAGATVLEKHYTLDPTDRTVPDNAFALDPADMDVYVSLANNGARLLGDGQMMPVGAESPARAGARRVLCAARDLPDGHQLELGDLIPLRPFRSDAFTPGEARHLVGRRLAEPVPAGYPIRLSAVT
jgi:N,N'-diacetyllegionaminate synthase